MFIFYSKFTGNTRDGYAVAPFPSSQSSTDGPNIKRNGGTQSKIPHVQLNPFVHRRSPPPVFPRFMSMTSVSRSLQTHSSPSRHAR